MCITVPGVWLWTEGQWYAHLPFGDLQDLKNQINLNIWPQKGSSFPWFHNAGKKSLPQLFSSFGGIGDVTCVEGTCVIGCVAEGLLELKLVNGSCKVPKMKTWHRITSDAWKGWKAVTKRDVGATPIKNFDLSDLLDDCVITFSISWEWSHEHIHNRNSNIFLLTWSSLFLPKRHSVLKNKNS